MDFEEEFEQRSAGLILIEPGNSQTVSERLVRAQATDDQRNEMGLSTTAWADEKQMVLVIGEGAFPHSLHRVLEKFLSLN